MEKRRWITLSGVAADASLWADFDDQWKQILANRNPPAKYIHMREAVGLNGEFSHRQGWSVKKVEALLRDLLFCLNKLDKKRFRQFACSIDLHAHAKLTAEGHDIEEPITICTNYCPYTVLQWYVTKYEGIIHSLHYFFDQGEPFEEKFKERWKREKENIVDPRAALEVWSLIKSITTADMRDSAALQAADMLAWATNRELTSEAERPYRVLSNFMKQIIPSTWVVWDEKKMRENCQ